MTARRARAARIGNYRYALLRVLERNRWPAMCDAWYRLKASETNIDVWFSAVPDNGEPRRFTRDYHTV